MKTQTVDPFTAKYNPLLSLQGDPDFEILKNALGPYCAAIKSNWIATNIVDNWSLAERADVAARIEKANSLTSELLFKPNYFMDREHEEDRTWDAGFTIYVNTK